MAREHHEEVPPVFGGPDVLCRGPATRSKRPPSKMVAFEKGVNVTLGLPFIRTSPDHGTAYDIAGKGIANPSSMKEAIKLAVSMCVLC